MIDTIHLLIDVTHPNYEQLKNIIIGNQSQISFEHKDSIHKPNHFTFFTDSDAVLPFKTRSFFNSPSSNYRPSCLYHPRDNTLEINVSIPKYLYSTNVLQFIDCTQNGFQCNSNYLNTLIKHLRKAIKFFFRKYLDSDISFNHVYLRRIDFCYNQFFDTEADSYQYLSELKKDFYTYFKGKRVTTFDSSIMYVCKDYSYKIYHKGTEFKKHDLKVLQKSMESGYKCIPIPFLLHQANRILRYEITWRYGAMKKVINKSQEQYYIDDSMCFNSPNFMSTLKILIDRFSEINLKIQKNSYLSIEQIKQKITHEVEFIGNTSRSKVIMPFIALARMFDKKELEKLGFYSKRVLQLNYKYLKENNISIDGGSVVAPPDVLSYNTYFHIFYNYHYNYQLQYFDGN